MKPATLCQKANALNKQMCDALVKELASYGIIRTDNWNNPNRSTLYCYVFDQEEEHKEVPVMAIKATADALYVLPDYTKCHTTLDGMTDEDVDNLEEWEDVYGGNLLINATLYNICENIEDWLNKK